METVCFICHTPVQEGQIRAELPCHHSVHTMCLVNRVNIRFPQDPFFCHCGTIILQGGEENPIFDNEEEDDENQPTVQTQQQSTEETRI